LPDHRRGITIARRGARHACEEGIGTVDLRVIDGRNALALSRAELVGAAHRVRAAGLSVSCICSVEDLRGPIDELLALAEKFDMKLHIENEGVCNIAGLAGLKALVAAYRHPRLRTLVDIANAYRADLPPSAADLAGLLHSTDILHFKDYAHAARRFVAVGEGDIPIATLLAATLPAHGAPLTLTVETHASEPAATTRRSIRGLRQMVDGLGLS